MEVVEGDEVDPREFTAPGQWFQCRGKKVVPLEKSRREIEAEQFRLRQAGRKLAAFSVEKQEAQIPEGADKIILRPKGGLDRLLQRGPAYLTRMIKASAGVNIQETEEEDIVIPNTKQHSILIATTSGERKMKYVSINLIKLGEEEQVPVFAYVATPDGCGKGVVHGVDRIFTQEEIMQMLRHKANPEVIGAPTTTRQARPSAFIDFEVWPWLNPSGRERRFTPGQQRAPIGTAAFRPRAPPPENDCGLTAASARIEAQALNGDGVGRPSALGGRRGGAGSVRR
ncbi:hypothetical protein V5799_032728 [Amblyomma americanum]|uniref:Uncharacterized protein n=2 Tax=Amblyomma americanum TaxID=6943 RepID=A0AAQ4DQC3_AMBAM